MDKKHIKANGILCTTHYVRISMKVKMNSLLFISPDDYHSFRNGINIPDKVYVDFSKTLCATNMRCMGANGLFNGKSALPYLEIEMFQREDHRKLYTQI